MNVKLMDQVQTSGGSADEKVAQRDEVVVPSRAAATMPEMVKYLKRVGGQRGRAPDPTLAPGRLLSRSTCPMTFQVKFPIPTTLLAINFFIGDQLYHQGISWQEFGFVAGMEYAPAPHHSSTVYTYLGHEPKTNLEKERQTAVVLSREC